MEENPALLLHRHRVPDRAVRDRAQLLSGDRPSDVLLAGGEELGRAQQAADAPTARECAGSLWRDFSLTSSMPHVDHGIVTFLTDYGIEPLTLARAAEERGFDALFLTEHTHIPVSRETPWPGGAELPRRYAHTFDPFVALGAMAAVTQRIALGTGVSLVAQHDPIVLAKAAASVDVLAGGRFELGVGPGWNVEEAAHHGARRHRTARMLETVDAVRAIWTADEAEYHGRFVDLAPSWSWPKPVRVPPVLIGGGGPTVLDRVLSHGDGWIPLRVPVSGLDAFGERVAELRRRGADAGRGHLPVTIYGAASKPEVLESYAAAGVDRVLFELPDHGPGGGEHADPGADGRGTDATLRELDRLATLRP